MHRKGPGFLAHCGSGGESHGGNGPIFHQQKTILRTGPEVWKSVLGPAAQLFHLESTLEKRICSWTYSSAEDRPTNAIARRLELGFWGLQVSPRLAQATGPESGTFPLSRLWLSCGLSIPQPGAPFQPFSAMAVSPTPLLHGHHPFSFRVPLEEPGFR